MNTGRAARVPRCVPLASTCRASFSPVPVNAPFGFALRTLAFALAISAAFGPLRVAHAQSSPAPLDLASALQRIEAARATLRSLDAEFDQERAMGLFAQTLRSQGRLHVERPARVRWEILAPDPSEFRIEGTRVSYRTATSSAAADPRRLGALGAVLEDLAAFLGGSLALLQPRYTLAVQTLANGRIVLSAIPRDARLARVLESVRLRFAADLRVLELIEIREPGGDHSFIHLRNVRVTQR